MKNSEILQQARGLIERRTKDSITHALFGVCKLTPGATYQCNQLYHWIGDLLGTCGTYEGWLWKYHTEFAKEQGVPKFNVSVQEGWDVCRPGRLAWLDWMIQYWEAEEAKVG